MLLIVVSVSSTLACVSEPALLSSVAIVGNAPRPTSILFSLRENIKATDRRIRGVLLLQLISWPSMYLFLGELIATVAELYATVAELYATVAE